MKTYLVRGPWRCSEYSDLVMRYVYRFTEIEFKDGGKHGWVSDVWMESSGYGKNKNNTYLRAMGKLLKSLASIRSLDELEEFANMED